MKLLPILILLCTGCARFAVTQRDESPTRTILTEIRGTAWFSSAQSLSNLKALQTDKTQSFGTESLGQRGATNTVATIQAITELLKAANP